MVEPSLVAEIKETEGSIERHKMNLAKFQNDEREIRQRFEGDITRFMTLKGLSAAR
jgi:hypothetical protein